jgi:8-amino-7-oxononanoate synthase
MTEKDISASDAMRNAWLTHLRAALDQRRQTGLFRELRRVESPSTTRLKIEGAEYLQFCTNNYLGLATHPEVIDAAREATARFGTGAGASRLVAGSMDLHHQLEDALATFKGTERALLFPTGFMANLAVLTAFAGADDLIVSDKLNHASLLDAAKFSGALCRTFPHRTYSRAEDLLAKRPVRDEAIEEAKLKFLVTDSVFSMDGDIADLPAACAIARRAGALVILDEAHGTGVLGPRGAGLAELQNVEHDIDITIGTLSKALGSLGGFVCGKKEAIETLVNSARSFIYTTALPPACAAAALASLQIVQREPARRERVMRLATTLKQELTTLGFNCGDSASPIIPVILGDAGTALKAAAFLRDRAIWVPAIRPPTVPPGAARLRIGLMATHSDADVEQLLHAMRDLRDAHV